MWSASLGGVDTQVCKCDRSDRRHLVDNIISLSLCPMCVWPGGAAVFFLRLDDLVIHVGVLQWIRNSESKFTISTKGVFMTRWFFPRTFPISLLAGDALLPKLKPEIFRESSVPLEFLQGFKLILQGTFMSDLSIRVFSSLGMLCVVKPTDHFRT